MTPFEMNLLNCRWQLIEPNQGLAANQIRLGLLHVPICNAMAIYPIEFLGTYLFVDLIFGFAAASAIPLVNVLDAALIYQ